MEYSIHHHPTPHSFWANKGHLIGECVGRVGFGSGSLITKSCPALVTPWTVACQAPLFTGFSRQAYRSVLPFPSPGGLPNPGIEPGSPAFQADSLPTELWGKIKGRCAFRSRLCHPQCRGLSKALVPPPFPSSTGVLSAQETGTSETVEGSPGSCRVWRVYDTPKHAAHIVRVLGHAGVSRFRCDWYTSIFLRLFYMWLKKSPNPNISHKNT